LTAAQQASVREAVVKLTAVSKPAAVGPDLSRAIVRPH
jgi:hypothetical protein